MIRFHYLNPPLRGALIVKKILGNPEYVKEWEVGFFLGELYKIIRGNQGEIKMVFQRLQEIRKLLVDELKRIECKGDWDHILQQVGQFYQSGLTSNN